MVQRSSENNNLLCIRLFAILFVVFLYCFPIIHANFYYTDDYFRSETGRIFMADVGRFFSQILFFIINFQESVIDIAPLPQIAAIIILTYALYCFSISWGLNIFSTVVVLPLMVCSPFFCENMSYRFDSITMALALSCVIFSFCFEGKIPIKKYYFLRVFLIFSSLCFYQPAFTAAIIISIFDSILLIRESFIKNSLNRLFNNISCAFLAVVFYKLMVKIIFLFIGEASYAVVHSTVLYDPGEVFHNFKKFSRLALKEFGTHGGSLEIGLGFVVIFSICFFLSEYIKKKEYAKAVVSLLLVTLAVCSLGGAMVFLASPVFSMRVMMGSGPFLCGIMLLLIGKKPVFFGFKKFLLIISGWVLFVQIITSYEWSNAIKNQVDLNEYIAASLTQDLYSATNGDLTYVRVNAFHGAWVKKHNTLKWVLVSDAPLAPLAKVVWKNRPVLFDDEPMLSSWIFPKILMNKKSDLDNIIYFSEGDDDFRFSKGEARDIIEKCNYDRKIVRLYYFLYVKKSSVVIDFHKTCSN